MNNNLPQIYKDNFLYNLFKKIKMIFFRKRKVEIPIENSNHVISDNDKNIEKFKFTEEIKVKVTTIDREVEKKKFMENLTNNPQLLEEFSNERLEKILQYYKDENTRKKELLKKISA